MSIPRTSSKDVGSYLEHELVETLPIEPVPDTEADWMDARVSHHISMGTVDLSDVLCLEQGTPVEIKGACYRYSRRRGRFYIKQRAHQQLLDAGGVYCFVVYDDAILATAWRRAESIDQLISWWTQVRNPDRSERAFTQLDWSHVIPPAVIEGGSRS